jgi:sugar phosphate permease
MALGAFISPKLESVRRKTQIISCGMIIGVSISLLALLPLLQQILLRRILSIALMAIVGISIGIVNVMFGVAFMEYVDKEYLGRVGGITNAILCLCVPVLSLICSGLAAFAPVPVILFLSGILSLGLYFAASRMKIYDQF